MRESKYILKKCMLTLIAIVVAGAMVFSVGTDEVAAATKKPDKVTISSCKSYDYNAVKITWKKAKNAKKYQIYRAASKYGKYKLVKTTTSRTYINKKLTTGNKYYYKVRGINGSQKGSFSYKKYAVPKLKKVTGEKATSSKYDSISLSWNKVTGATGYQVYRAESKDGKYSRIKSTTDCKYKNTNLTTGKTYYYKVRAYRKVNGSYKFGAYSNVVSCSWTLDIDAIRSEMLEAINAEREKAGVEPVDIYDGINYTAQEKAKDLYETGVFDHYSDNLGWFYDQWEKSEIKYEGGGENIACGQSDVTAVMKSWMQSSGHKANILNKNWTHVGIGYYKGNWVQQFAMNPKGGHKSFVETGIDVTCTCGYVNTVEEWKMFSTDGSGNIYGCIYCESCNKFIEKCPCCEEGIFVEAEISVNCSKSYKCNICGNQQQKTCITNCPSCNSSVVSNSLCREYKITFDSTKTYNDENYERKEGGYFQQYITSMTVCKDCNSIIVVDEYGCENYLEFFEKLKKVVGQGDDIFEYIHFEKQVDSQKLYDTEKGSVFKPIYKFVETPKVYSLEELVGTGEI